MKKSLMLLSLLGLVVGLNAGTVCCDYPVTEVQPVYKTVTKLIPSKECWEEEKCMLPPASNCAADPCGATIVSQRCTVTKCKTVYNRVEENILVGYNNFAVVCGKKIKKFSKTKLKTIRVTSTY